MIGTLPSRKRVKQDLAPLPVQSACRQAARRQLWSAPDSSFAIRSACSMVLAEQDGAWFLDLPPREPNLVDDLLVTLREEQSTVEFLHRVAVLAFRTDEVPVEVIDEEPVVDPWPGTP